MLFRSGIMLGSVFLWHGSDVEGFYVFYQKVLFLGAFVALAHAGTRRSVEWKQLALGAVVLIDIIYLSASLITASPVVLGPFVNPNYLASFLLPGIAVCTASVLLGSSLLTRLAAVGAGLFLFYGIGRTSSRGATLAALVMLGIAGFRMARRRGLSWIIIGVAGIAIAGLSFVANPGLMRKFLDRGQRDPYNYQRGQIWLGTLSMIAQHPIAGVGLGRYYYTAKQFTPPVPGTIARYRKWPNIAHSEYLQSAAEIGVPGLIDLDRLAVAQRHARVREVGVREDVVGRRRGQHRAGAQIGRAHV